MSIIDTVRKQRREIDKRDGETLTRLTNAYKAKYAMMRTRAEALVAYVAAHPDMTAAQIKRTQRYKELEAEVNTELDEFAGYLKTEIDVTARAGMTTGEKHALALLAAYGVVGRRIGIDRSPQNVVNVIAAFLAPDSALYQRIKTLAPYHAKRIAESLIDAVVLGTNPLVTGKEAIAPLLQIAYRELQKSAGLALTDALRMARTAQLWAYRESSRAIYAANADVVQGWYWYAELDASTCMSCVAQHGTFHEIGDQLDDHYNGRCAMIPAVVGQDNPVTKSGQEWFDGLPESEQARMMGAEYYQAYKGGAYSFEQLSRQVEDDTYGHMHNVTPLYELLGAEKPVTK